MALVKWDPMGELTTFRQQMDRLFDSFLGREISTPSLERWNPSLEMSETSDEILVKIDVPGIEEKDISLTLSGDNLVVKGERKMEKEEKDKHYHKIETSYGAFQRVLPMPVSVDPEKIKAELKGGVLSIHLAKKAELKPREIPVVTK